MELTKETQVFCFVAVLVSESCTVCRCRVCEPVPRHCLLPEDTSELWRRCEASVSLSILRSIILLLLFSFFVNYKIVLINKYCPRLYLYYFQVFFFCFLSSTTYLAFLFRSFIKVKQRPNESHSPVPVQLSSMDSGTEGGLGIPRTCVVPTPRRVRRGSWTACPRGASTSRQEHPG